MEINSYTGIVQGINICSKLNSLSSIVVDYENKKTLFVSENLLYLDEAIQCDCKRNSEIPYWSLVDDDVLEQLKCVQTGYFNLLNSLSFEEYRDHILIMDYPILVKGHNVYINSRFCPLQFSEEGSIQLALFTFAPSTKTSMFSMVITSFEKRWQYDSSTHSFVGLKINRLTATDKAILQRAKKGLSNEKIAEELFLGVNTIKSHKTHIFKKLAVSNIAEALVVLDNYQLL